MLSKSRQEKNMPSVIYDILEKFINISSLDLERMSSKFELDAILRRVFLKQVR